MHLCLIGASLVTASGCRRAEPADPPLRPTATIKDIMDSMIDPSADALWDSVATTISAAGIEEKQPRTDEEWADVRRRSITLMEATNLLLLDGRRVAKPGEKAENPDVELSPEQIEATIGQDREAFVKLAHGLYDAAQLSLRAVETRNVPALLDSGGTIDGACESCHLKYWYPLSKQAEKAREGAGSVRKP